MAAKRPELQSSLDETEMAALEAQWGRQARRHIPLEVADPFLTVDGQMLIQADRRAEICYVMHRGDPADGLLLHTKTIYPEGAYRLPTGGVHLGESVMQTLAREIEEETGLVVGDAPDRVQVQRMLGVVTYAMDHRELGRRFSFATYHFLVQMPADGVLAPQDATERIAGWRWVAPAELSTVARQLTDVGAWAPDWADWGRYRTISHTFVAEALARAVD